MPPYCATRLPPAGDDTASRGATATLPNTRHKETTEMNLIIQLIVGGIAGWLASLIMNRDASQGIILNVVVGIVGGVLGGWLLPLAGLGLGGGWIGYLVTALIGAVVLLLIVNLITRGKAR